MGQIPGQFEEIGGGEDPGVDVGDGDDAVGGDEGVGALDDHVARGVDEDEGGVAGVGLHEPDDDGDVVGDALKRHRNGAVGLEEVDGAAVVVGEDGGLGLEGREGLHQLHQVLPDVPLHVLRVRQRRRPTLREHAVEELLRVLRHPIW